MKEFAEAIDVLELTAMSHAEAQRRDNPDHMTATAIDLVKARHRLLDMARAIVEAHQAHKPVIEEAAACLDRNGATGLARRLRTLLK